MHMEAGRCRCKISGEFGLPKFAPGVLSVAMSLLYCLLSFIESPVLGKKLTFELKPKGHSNYRLFVRC